MAFGHCLWNSLESRAGEFEYIYNTAPALLLTEKLLEKIREDALIIDLHQEAAAWIIRRPNVLI